MLMSDMQPTTPNYKAKYNELLLPFIALALRRQTMQSAKHIVDSHSHMLFLTCTHLH